LWEELLEFGMSIKPYKGHKSPFSIQENCHQEQSPRIGTANPEKSKLRQKRKMLYRK